MCCSGEAVAVVHQKVYRMFSPTIFRRRGDGGLDDELDDNILVRLKRCKTW